MDDKLLPANTDCSHDEAKLHSPWTGHLASAYVARDLFDLSRSGASRLLAICVEPGMGSSDVVDALLLLYGGHRRSCRRKDLTGSTPDRAARIIARTARELPV